jgi:hypothetical protein
MPTANKGKVSLPDLAEVISPEDQQLGLAPDKDRVELSAYVALNNLARVKPDELTDDDLGRILENAMGFAFCTLRMCKPLIEEMRERFKARTKDSPRIRGCASFQEWCRKVLHRSEQAVYLLLRENKRPPEPEPEPVFVTPDTAVPKQQVTELLNLFGEKIPVAAVHVDGFGDEHISWTADSVDARVVDNRAVGPGKIIPPEEYNHICVVGVVNTFLLSLVKHLTKEEKWMVLEELVGTWKGQVSLHRPKKLSATQGDRARTKARKKAERLARYVAAPGELPNVEAYNGYLQRGKKYAIEVLATGGMGASKGLTITAKLKKYMLATAATEYLMHITVPQWEAIWATLDALAEQGNEKAVAAVEEVVRRAQPRSNKTK